MSCVRPLTAYWRDVQRSAITFDMSHSATKVSFKLPCGRCIGCRLEKARQWGVRCLHEKKMWADNAYVTLTYDNKFLPDGGTLMLRDLQLFMKRLRKAKNSSKENPLRFFAGGEYGEDNGRPHYHCLLFNCAFPDKLLWTKNKRGEPLYTSKELEALWGLGFCSIGEVTFDSAVYCAKYTLKKVTGDAAKDHYTVYDEEGVCYDRVPEFAVMSRRPGIGARYYEKYGDEIRASDSVVVNGVEQRPPRFYDERSKLVYGPSRVGHTSFGDIQKARKRAGVMSSADNTPERLRVKETLMIKAAEKKERKL